MKTRLFPKEWRVSSDFLSCFNTSYVSPRLMLAARKVKGLLLSIITGDRSIGDVF